MLYTDDVNIVYANFMNTFNILYSLHCPTKNVKIKDNCRKNWLTNGLNNACRKKNQLYRLFLRYKTESSTSQYKTCKNKRICILRYAEKAYYSELLAEKRGDIKET